MKIETHSFRIEVVDSSVPDCSRFGCQPVPKLLAVDAAVAANTAIAEHFKEVRIAKSLDRSELEFQQRVLVWIDVHAIDAGGIVNHVVQGIATGTRDHHDAILRSDAEDGVIHCRIFPALVINKVARVDLIEEPA